MSSLVTFKRRAANFEERGQEHSGEWLEGLFAPGSGFTDTIFVNCPLNLATFQNATLRHVQFTGCGLIGASFRGAALDDCSFTDCSGTGVLFSEARLRDVRFLGCRLEGASFAGARLQRPVTFRNTLLKDADLRFYESESEAPFFEDCDLRGATLSINCEFWNGTFSDREVRDFGYVWARASRDPEIIAFVQKRWGVEDYEKLDAYMRRG